MGIKIKGVRNAQLQLVVTQRDMVPGMKQVLLDVANAASAHMKARYLSGNPIKVRTGKLRSNWQVRGFAVSPNERF